MLEMFAGCLINSCSVMDNEFISCLWTYLLFFTNINIAFIYHFLCNIRQIYLCARWMCYSFFFGCGCWYPECFISFFLDSLWILLTFFFMFFVSSVVWFPLILFFAFILLCYVFQFPTDPYWCDIFALKSSAISMCSHQNWFWLDSA